MTINQYQIFLRIEYLIKSHCVEIVLKISAKCPIFFETPYGTFLGPFVFLLLCIMSLVSKQILLLRQVSQRSIISSRWKGFRWQSSHLRSYPLLKVSDPHFQSDKWLACEMGEIVNLEKKNRLDLNRWGLSQKLLKKIWFILFLYVK